jgi:hypothetical protein
MPQQAALGTVEQLRALIQTVREALSRSREIITRVDATRPPKPPTPSSSPPPK